MSAEHPYTEAYDDRRVGPSLHAQTVESARVNMSRVDAVRLQR